MPHIVSYVREFSQYYSLYAAKWTITIVKKRLEKKNLYLDAVLYTSNEYYDKLNLLSFEDFGNSSDILQ